MSAFEDILKAEQAAASAILAAEQAAAEALDIARQEQKQRLEMKKTELATAATATLSAHEADVAARGTLLKAETSKAIASFQAQASARKGQLVKMIVDSFV